MLEIKNLHAYYGGIHALKGVGISVSEGEIVTIIGANGAGKSTLLNAVSGIVRYREGSIFFKGKPLPRLPHLIVKRGIVQVPEGRLIFANLTVKDNLMLGAYLRSDKEGIKRDLEKVYELFPRLKEREKQMAGTLSGGEQQMLAIGRGLMSNPELILLDEPSLGLAPIMVETIFRVIKDIKNLGKTILLVEQNAYKALSTADSAYMLEQGRVVKSGRAADLINDPGVKESYLGVKVNNRS
ncbi:ABC transporter ATP-binding protein [Thermosediminibacter litoriperuensis]|uniref:Amino acid/amide ABC transporter ATP-binding protein 2, HAAT family (TC 3.A.1.4.-) n=1 Tax=Thermosediminibacter litoriperuensis TaxID=291989 RepID=A0A5S5AN64_9FIRM|nr:ABC transporter ATP-binding protein [Thermosediminibacter litoriperuensis]TYP52471.1 amino acid/amide ABC transporter ATP-binding protein 2, HAAT family (TC 3.A.1.4.-) [Thermosediminibacter litoriperuensis]